MTRPRIIPFLLLQNGRLVKTVKFANPVYVGDPINAVRIFNEKEVDELVLLDIGATSNGTEPDYGLVGDIASEAFMPVGYGGGISSLGQIEALFKAGIEKVSVNSATYTNPELISEAARVFGSQSVVASVDVRSDFLGRPQLYSNGGKVRQKVALREHVQRLEGLGAGEIILNSIDRDGQMKGLDLALIGTVANSLPIPVVGIGGAGNARHLREALQAGASAVGAGSMFVFHGPHKAVLISYIDPTGFHG